MKRRSSGTSGIRLDHIHLIVFYSKLYIDQPLDAQGSAIFLRVQAIYCKTIGPKE